MDELRPGLWTWTAPHPDWHEQPVVRSYALEHGGALVLIDPMAPPEGLLAGREVRVALTAPWHGRSAAQLDAPEAELDFWPAFYPDERVYWLPDHSAMVFGDSFPGGPIPDEWLPEGKTRADYDAWLAGFRGLRVELVLPTHGDPGGRELLYSGSQPSR